MNSWINLSALWKIVVIGLIAGAGLPALFAVGLRALSMGPNGARTATAGASGTDSSVSDDRVVGGSSLGMVLAVVCFLVVLAAIAAGIYFIVNPA